MELYFLKQLGILNLCIQIDVGKLERRNSHSALYFNVYEFEKIPNILMEKNSDPSSQFLQNQHRFLFKLLRNLSTLYVNTLYLLRQHSRVTVPFYNYMATIINYD